LYDILRDNSKEGLSTYELLEKSQKYTNGSELSLKQCRTRLNALIKAGIVRKKKQKKYCLSSYGELMGSQIRDPLKSLERLRWRLATIDATEDTLTKEEHQQFIKKIIDDPELQNIIIGLKYGNLNKES
jgi:hypothetical protein